jgi:hypothetical protein
MSNDIFKPSYVWKSDSFPFFVYFENKFTRFIFIENLLHNFNWLSKYRNRIKSSDFFFVQVGWHHFDYLIKECSDMFDALDLNREQFIIFANDPDSLINFQKYGFRCVFINQNAWLDENSVMKIMPGFIKKYDAIYIARNLEWKRHYLSDLVSNKAFVVGSIHGEPLCNRFPSSNYINSEVLNPSEVCIKINESKCGLILSEVEGACYASSEYLLCGIPVVSSSSWGGRDIWYNNNNSLIVNDPDPNKIMDAVNYFCNISLDPYKIRFEHIKKSIEFRTKFIELNFELYSQVSNGFYDFYDHFDKNFIHKMKVVQVPDFDNIFLTNS